MSLAEFCEYPSSQAILTEWQIDKLRNGKFKGFFIDGYKLLSHLAVRDKYTAYLAEHVDSGRRVALLITPPQLAKADTIEYRIVEPRDA